MARRKKNKVEIDWKDVILVTIFILGFIMLYYSIFYMPIEIEGEEFEIEILKNIDVNESVEDVCSDIEDENIRNICLVEESVCSEDSCFEEKAMMFGDEAFCQEIKDEDMRVGCSAYLIASEVIIRSVTEDNVDVCLEIEDEPNKEYCYDNFYNAKRFNDDDLSYCDKIVNSDIKDVCLGVY